MSENFRGGVDSHSTVHQTHPNNKHFYNFVTCFPVTPQDSSLHPFLSQSLTMYSARAVAILDTLIVHVTYLLTYLHQSFTVTRWPECWCCCHLTSINNAQLITNNWHRLCLNCKCKHWSIFTVRRSLHGICYSNSVCPSVCLSVCLSHSWTVSTWIDLRSWFLHHRVAPSF